MKELVYEVAGKELADYMRRGVLTPEEAEAFLQSFVQIYSKVANKDGSVEEDISSRIRLAMSVKEKLSSSSSKREMAGLGFVVALGVLTEKDIRSVEPEVFMRHLDILMTKADKLILNMIARKPYLLKALLGIETGGSRLNQTQAVMLIEIMKKTPRALFEKILFYLEPRGVSARTLVRLSEIMDKILDEHGVFKAEVLSLIREMRERGLSVEEVRHKLMQAVMKEAGRKDSLLERIKSAVDQFVEGMKELLRIPEQKAVVRKNHMRL